MITIKAKAISYSKDTRDRNTVGYIVIHNTGNDGDTAENNGKYYKNGNVRKAGAHFFIDQKGNIVKSIAMERSAWAVGGAKYANDGGKLYNTVTNYNSISIELCDIINKDPSEEMIAAIKECIKYIQKYCPNAKTIIRHYDVNGKPCPIRYIDTKKWNKLRKEIMK